VKIVRFLIIAIVATLSIAAGLAKVMQAPAEMEFLQGFGFSPGLVVAFGLVQILAGLLLVLKKTRRTGAVLAASAFAVSTVLILTVANWAFGLSSILPIVLAGAIIYQSAKPTQGKPTIAESGDVGSS
jgi:hypothetical protein